MLGSLAISIAPPVHAEPPPLAGLLAVSDSLNDRWPAAGAFLYPVGAPRDFRVSLPGQASYRILRGLSSGNDSTPPHRGADIGNGHGGGEVHAAAAGLVVCGAGDGWRPGFGNYVTLAHRLRGGGLVYTVYAHLAAGSLRVRRGERVWAGRVLGRVGHSGRASTNHLHFEVREAGEYGERWEKLTALDPLDFVAARLPAHDRDAAGEWGTLAWAECSGLLAAEEDASRPLDHARWRELLRALCGARDDIASPASDEAVARFLRVASSPDADSKHASRGTVTWDELWEGFARLSEGGCAAAVGPRSAELSRACLERFGTTRPTHGHAPSGQPDGEPTLADACLAAAELTAVTPAAPRVRKVHRAPSKP
jgi:murein DD-endopeptidase MepM/ murein hydrolase activator NlpD